MEQKEAFEPERYQARSLSPAYWYVYDAAKAKREKSRGQVGRPYCTEADARAAIARAKAQP